MPASETPASVLRRAEARLRKEANAATPGRWQETCLGSEGCMVINDGKLRDRKRVARFGQKEWKADHADAVYVASMGPDVGLALARWLGDLAEQAEQSGNWALHSLSPGPLKFALAYLNENEENPDDH